MFPIIFKLPFDSGISVFSAKTTISRTDFFIFMNRFLLFYLRDTWFNVAVEDAREMFHRGINSETLQSFRGTN